MIQKPLFSFLGGRLRFISFRVRLVFLVAPANRKYAIHQRHYVASSFLRLRRCFLRSAFLVIWILDRAAKQLKSLGKFSFDIFSSRRKTKCFKSNTKLKLASVYVRYALIPKIESFTINVSVDQSICLLTNPDHVRNCVSYHLLISKPLIHAIFVHIWIVLSLSVRFDEC
nr:MAG TPA: hypothetical protein [Caudoviricetes sp.]